MYKSVYLTITVALFAVSLTSVDAILPLHSVPKLSLKEAATNRLAERYWDYSGYSYNPFEEDYYYNRYRNRRKQRKPKRPTRKPVTEEKKMPVETAPETPKKEETAAPQKPAEIIVLNKSKDPEQEDHEDEERDEKEP